MDKYHGYAKIPESKYEKRFTTSLIKIESRINCGVFVSPYKNARLYKNTNTRDHFELGDYEHEST